MSGVLKPGFVVNIAVKIGAVEVVGEPVMDVGGARVVANESI